MKCLNKIGICVFLISVTISAIAQDEINYSPKLLVREINALGIENNTSEELTISSATAGKIGKGKYFIFESRNSLYYAYVGRVNTCRAGGCKVNNTIHDNSDSEYFDYFILFNRKGNVHKVRVFNYRATHGSEITAAGWLKQFEGYDGTRSLNLGKQIDAISGATISVFSIAYDIESKTRLLQTILSQQNLTSTNLK